MNYYLLLALLLFVYMNGWFIFSLIKKRNDVADLAWGLGFIFLAWFAFFISGFFGWKALVVNLLITIWGSRLALHIYRRNQGKPEDYRYAKWREEWGKNFLIRSYFQVYILQGALLYLIALSFIFINLSPVASPGLSDLLGVAVWLLGFYFESTADRQLSEFIKDPANKGKLMTSGLWKYSRHPNYFGEVTQWWGIFIIALSLPLGYLTVVSPLTITLLILFVSGIPLLEKKYSGNPEFEEYKKKTSVFIPLPPKNS